MVGCEGVARPFLPVGELGVDLAVQGVQDLLDVRLGPVEDLLERGGDLFAFLLVRRFGLGLARVDLPPGRLAGRGEAGHRLGAGRRRARLRGLEFGVLRGPGLGGCRGGLFLALLLLRQGVVEVRFVAPGQLLLGDVRLGHSLFGVALAFGEVGDLLRLAVRDGVPAFGAPGFPGGWSAVSGVTSFSVVLEVSGVSPVAVAMSSEEVSLPSATLPSTSSLIRSALPESENLSASSRFFGACASTAWLTAAMKAALSKSPGSAAFIFSACCVFACACRSSGGATAASWAARDSAVGAGWAASLCFFAPMSAFTRRIPGACAGGGFTGGV